MSRPNNSTHSNSLAGSASATATFRTHRPSGQPSSRPSIHPKVAATTYYAAAKSHFECRSTCGHDYINMKCCSTHPGSSSASQPASHPYDWGLSSRHMRNLQISTSSSGSCLNLFSLPVNSSVYSAKLIIISISGKRSETEENPST